MSDKKSIEQNLRYIALGRKDYIEQIILCEVVSVDGVTCVCQPLESEEGEYSGVRLVAEEHSTNMLITPAIGSVVGIVPSNDLNTAEMFVVMFSQIDSIALRGDQYDGLVKVADLVDKLNNLENKVNDLITAYNAHTHAVLSTPSVSNVTTSLIVGSLTLTVQADLENENVKHG